MFNSIKTTKENRNRIALLTKKLSLGSENIIARLAFAYSISSDKKFDLTKIDDSQGKEYSYKVLFGDYGVIYIAMLCVHYNLHKTDRDIPKYVKKHIDDGLIQLEKDLSKRSGTGIDFLIKKIDLGLKDINDA